MMESVIWTLDVQQKYQTDSYSVTTSVAIEKLIRKVTKLLPETFFAYKRQLYSQVVFALAVICSAC